jgi:hypothetical protein
MLVMGKQYLVRSINYNKVPSGTWIKSEAKDCGHLMLVSVPPADSQW